jgi:hypothetical protein
VQRAVEALDRGHLQVLEAVVVAGDTADRAALLRLLGTDDAETVERLVQDLWRSALVWRSTDGDHVVRTVPEVLGTSVAGLGVPMRELRPSASPDEADPERIAATIAEAPDDSRAMLERMTWGPAFGVLPTARPGRTTARWLLEHRLLVPVSTDRVALPREVGLVLRAGRLHRTTELTPPPVESRQVSLVEAAAGGAASECLTHVDELAATWGAEPPRVLRAGGLSVRDLRSTQSALDLHPEHTAFVVELAYAAGLVADDGEVVPVWAPTPEIDDWSSSEAGHRWATLALAWLGSTRAPHLVGRRSTGTGPANALGPDVQWPAIRAIRREVLRELASLEPGSAPAADSLRERLAWRRPNRAGALLDEAVDAVLREAEWLGVTGRAALSEAGRVLVGATPPAGRRGRDSTIGAGMTSNGRSDAGGESDVSMLDRVASAMSQHLPSPVDHILVQADLTAVAPGPLVGGLGSFMRLAADVESRGGATVYRFTPESVRRALDAGWTAADLIETVRRSSRTPVPQPLEYLIADVARKHGQTRIGGAAAYIRSDDESVLDTMLASRDLAPLRLRRLAPTVLVSSADPRVLVDLLRDNGFAPVHEGLDGAVVHAETPRRRAGSRRRGPGPSVSPVDRANTQALVDGLRVGEATADRRRADEESKPGPRIQAMDPVVTLSLLRDAVADRHGVWIGYSDGHGATTRHLIHPQRVEGGRVRATDESGHEKSFSVHRITGATLDS